MVYIPAENTLQVELRGLLFGQDVETVQYFQRADTIETAEVAALFDWYEGFFIPAIRPQATADFTWDEIYATDLTTESSPTYARVLSPAIAGTAAGAAMPGSVACCISFRTNARGRSARGRNYFAGLGEPSVTGNNIAIGSINVLVAAYELMLGGGSFPSGWNWVVVSRYFNKAARIVALVREIVDVISTDIEVDSQRGRLR